MYSRSLLVLTVSTMVGLCGTPGSTQAATAPFTVTSPSFSDGGMFPKKNLAIRSGEPVRDCGGENISPALTWSDAPTKTKSFVVLMLDPDGNLGQGAHWLGYDIPARITSFAEGELTKGSKNFVGGKGTHDNALYIGPCPPPGDAPHHYMFMVIATDLEPNVLKPGLTKDEVYMAIKGHTLKATSIMGRYVD
jgi:Raf kinase inhibitor-like YbhB/YbcL family protein